MPSYNQIEIEEIFNRIWVSWPNKDGRSSALKALTVALRSGASADLIELACKIYSLENEGSEYPYKLSNFILQDHYKDVIEDCGNVQQYKAKLEAKRREAIEFIEEWNSACLPHWIKALDIDAKIPMVINALNDKFFKENKKIALDKALKIFNTKRREKEKFSNLVLNLKWFCNVSFNKHTVVGIMEGDYGEPQAEDYKKYLPPEIELSKEELTLIIEERKRLFNEVFKNGNQSLQSDSDPTDLSGF